MTRQLPTSAQVHDAMRAEIADARASERRPTVSSVERALGIPHATFARHFADLIDWFKSTVGGPSPEPRQRPWGDDSSSRALARLRTENRELRCIIDIYTAEIQRLSILNAELNAALAAPSNVRGLPLR